MLCAFFNMFQGQYIALEKKYCKAKRLLRDFQRRETDLLHREDFFMQLLQEKDTEYNALVKALKDRVIITHILQLKATVSFYCNFLQTYNK